MTDLEERIRELGVQVTARQQDKAKAEHALGVAEARRNTALDALKAEFSIASIDEARESLTEVEADLARECDAVEKALEEAG